MLHGRGLLETLIEIGHAVINVLCSGCTEIPVGAPRVLPGSLAAGKALPTDVQALAKEEWADAMAAAQAAAEHARRAQEASNAAERFARAGAPPQVGCEGYGICSG